MISPSSGAWWKRKVLKMFKGNDFRNESIAYALAAGMVDFGESFDRDGEKAARRARYNRRHSQKGAS